jgi:hypothetical protein
MVGTDVGAGIEEWGSQEIDLECINYAGVEPCKKWRVLSKSLAVLKRRWNAQLNAQKT